MMRNLLLMARYLGPTIAAVILAIVLIALGTRPAKAQDAPLTCGNCDLPVYLTQKGTVAGPAGDDVQVNGRLLFSSNYCGGAAPPPGLEQELRTPKPCPECVVYVTACPKGIPKPADVQPTDQPGTVNPTAQPLHTFKTDASGHFALNLPPGTYQLCTIENLGCTPFYQTASMSQQPLHVTVVKGKQPQKLELVLYSGCGFMTPP